MFNAPERRIEGFYVMRSYGTGPRYRSELETKWPKAQERESEVKVAQVPDPLHLCEIPEAMYAKREKLASKWVGLTHGAFLVPAAKAPDKSGTQSTGPKKRSRTQKNTKNKG